MASLDALANGSDIRPPEFCRGRHYIGCLTNVNSPQGNKHALPHTRSDEMPCGLPGGTRTPYPKLRRLVLYPDELRAACGLRWLNSPNSRDRQDDSVQRPQMTKPVSEKSLAGFFNAGRSTRIRTLDPLVPNQVRYRAAPHSENVKLYRRCPERSIYLGQNQACFRIKSQRSATCPQCVGPSGPQGRHAPLPP